MQPLQIGYVKLHINTNTMDKYIVQLPYKGNVQTYIKEDGTVAYTHLTVEEYLEDNPGCVVVTSEELTKLEVGYFVTPFQEITEDFWQEMLEVLPPLKWHDIENRFNVFFISEATNSHYHALYLKDRRTNKFYSCTESVFIKDAELFEKIKVQINPIA